MLLLIVSSTSNFRLLQVWGTAEAKIIIKITWNILKIIMLYLYQNNYFPVPCAVSQTLLQDVLSVCNTGDAVVHPAGQTHLLRLMQLGSQVTLLVIQYSCHYLLASGILLCTLQLVLGLHLAIPKIGEREMENIYIHIRSFIFFSTNRKHETWQKQIELN